MERLTHTERRVIEALIRHNAVRDDISLAQLASECYVSKSSVTKAIQKLGFGGFRDYSNAQQTYAQAAGNELYPESVTVESIDTSIDRLSRAFDHCVGRKSIVYPSRTPDTRPLAAYVSRKLSMFGAFAPVTYDYLAMQHSAPECGVAIFFPRAPKNSATPLDEIAGMFSQLFQYAQSLGFFTVVITDIPRETELTGADCRIDITPNPSDYIDLFTAKAMILFEHALASSAMPALQEGSAHEHVQP